MALVPRTNRKVLIKKNSNETSFIPVASDHWHQHTNNSVVCDTAGYWKLSGTISFGRSGGQPYDSMKARWSTVNGANSASVPTAINAPFFIFGGDLINFEIEDLITGSLAAKMNDVIVKVTTPQTFYLNTFASDNAGAFANIRIQVQVIAEYIGPSDLVTIG